jgi:hydroxymethylbilane synthase
VADGDGVRLRAEILSPDGREVQGGEDDDPEALARRLLASASPALRAMFAP